MSTWVATIQETTERYPLPTLIGAAIAWFLIYFQLEPLSYAIVGALPLAADGHLAGALQFFLYDTPKVLMLLTGVVYVMGMVHTAISPERTRKILSGRKTGVGNVMAASLGIVTPFCSCSAVPLFIGFVQAGIPLGVTFSYLIAAPMVNEIALVMLFGLFGWKIAALYLFTGLSIAIVAGLVLGSLRLDAWLEDWVLELRDRPVPEVAAGKMTWADRMDAGVEYVKEIVGKVWLYVVIGVGLGAAIHGYVPENYMASLLGSDTWWSIPAAVLLGVPMYANAAGIIPIVQALLAKGASLGAALAFMMAVVALSAPEMIILRKVLKPKLIATYVSIVTVGILVVGFVFNHVL